MQADELIEQWLQQTDAHMRRSWLAAHSAMLDDTGSMAIKDEANRLLRIDIRRSLAAADLLQQAGALTGNAMLEALGLRAAGDAHAIGLGEFQRALEQYHAAAAIYERLGMQVERIRTEASTIWSLASLGQYEQALAVGAAARDMLRQHGQWRPLATLTMNMAIIHGRLGNDLQALALLDDARAIWLTLDSTAGPLARIDQNRAILLRNLGQFEQSIAASQASSERLTALGQHIEAARARQNLAVTYYTLGRYNEALQILDEVREQFRADGRERDSLLVGLFISDCLLQLRRFAAALAICQEARALFRARGVTFEAAQSLMNEAIARAGLQQGDQALVALDEARAMFEGQGLATWVAACDLERAAVLAHQGRYAECARAADHSRQRFAERHLPVQQLRATMLGARATAELGNVEQACYQAGEAVAEAERLQLAFLSYQGHHLLGRLLAEHDPAASQDHFERAMAALERMRNHVMVEFRADFLDDKQAVYADAALLALAHGRIEDALLAVERAKSRVLRDLLAQRIDLSITPRSAADLPLTEELDQLQAERNRLVRRWESRELVREDPNLAEQERLQAHGELIAVEQRIIDLWHRLLVRNADYARDAALWLPHEEAALPRPESGTLLLEYAELRGRWMVFLVSAEQTRLVELAATPVEIERMLRFLWLNINSAATSAPDRLPALARNARQILKQLYDRLLAPFEREVKLYERLVVVPHSGLHYLPFHALYDGERYLVEWAECSYLPSARLLARKPREQAEGGAFVAGYSHHGRLPFVVEEARAVAQLLDTAPLLESAVTTQAIREQVAGRLVVHLATHGEFRSDSPLFSGLACADGRLTTLDVFNLPLQASLLVLSGCESGRSVLGGGGELLGLMRACLHAGAASLLVSLWAIDDQTTAAFMDQFYRNLVAGQHKGAALRNAQRRLIEATDRHVTHPFFWAPFMLVGDLGMLGWRYST